VRTKQIPISSIACLVGAALALAQSVPPPPAPPAQTNPNAPALKVTSRVVQVNVIVQDKNGQPVTGLTRDDFTILDQGQTQTIASFAEQTNRVTAAMASASAANTFSNRAQERYGAPPNVSVILIDSLNMLDNYGEVSRSNMSMARAQVVKFLAKVQPQDRVALYFLSNKIYILHDFTNNTAELLRAMDIISHLQMDQPNATPAMDFALNAPNSRMMDPGWAREGISRGTEVDKTNRVKQSAAALEAIAKHLAGIPGRKNLIWISGCFPFLIYTIVGPLSFDSQISEAARVLSDANVAVYAVDARGLTVGKPDPQTVNTMTVLADRTGGRVLHNTNDLSGAIRTAIDDSRVSYVLSYYPDHNKWNGDFREIKVKVNRPGVEVRARRGYFATPDVVIAAKSKEEIMVDAAKNPIESAALGMDVQANPVDAAGARQIKAQVKIDPAQMHIAKTGDLWTDSVDVKWVQIAADGRVLASTSQTFNLNISQEDYENVLRKGLTFSGNVKLAKDATDVRIVARDSGNGSVGTVNIPVDRLFTSSASK
jgi:VWFA-related protein